MIALVYSGSRYADWKLADKGKVVAEFKTTGINPYFNDRKHILQILNKRSELINNAEKIKRIYFFGAGVSSAERKDFIYDTLNHFFKNSKVHVYNDLQAAALATCSEKPGITGVIGSGSAAGFFDGKKIKPNNFGLGYILGDEGSANWLGRQLLKDYLYGTLPADIHQKFLKKYGVNRKEVLDKVYRQPQPALYLSSFVDFLLDNQQAPYVKNLLLRGFDIFFQTYILPLKKQSPLAPIYMVGTVAFNFRNSLTESASKYNLEISAIIKEPIYSLADYYSNKAN